MSIANEEDWMKTSSNGDLMRPGIRDITTEQSQLFIDCMGAMCSSNYSTINGSYGGYFYEENEDISFWQVPQLVIVIMLFVFIVLGNSCVLLAVGLSDTGKKTRMNFFIMNLAIADLAVGFFHVTVDIAEKSLVEWYGGHLLCKVIRFLQEIVVYASSFMLVSLSIDRVDAIARPMKFARQAFTMRALVYTAWVTSGLLAAPSLFLFDEVLLHNQTHCIITLHQRWHWQVYITLVALTAFIIPALIITVCYSIIIYVIWDKGRGFTNAFEPPTSRQGILGSTDQYETVSRECRNRTLGQSHIRVNRENVNKGIIPQAKIRTFKMTLIIVCVFVLSWCPYFVFNLIDVYETPSQKTSTQYAVTILIQSLAPLNSAANPVIYGVFSTKLCNNLRKIPMVNCLFKWLCRCRRKKSRITHTGHQSQTEQTYLDATSSRAGARRLNNSNKLYLDHETTTLLHNSHVINGNEEPMAKYVSRNSQWQITGQREREINRVRYVETKNKSKQSHNRRPSGLPLVTRRMTSQDTLLLETYRFKTTIIEETDVKDYYKHRTQLKEDTCDGIEK